MRMLPFKMVTPKKNKDVPERWMCDGFARAKGPLQYWRRFRFACAKKREFLPRQLNPSMAEK